MGGIEPPNGGIKIRCLTAWLHPKKNLRGFFNEVLVIRKGGKLLLF